MNCNHLAPQKTLIISFYPHLASSLEASCMFFRWQWQNASILISNRARGSFILVSSWQAHTFLICFMELKCKQVSLIHINLCSRKWLPAIHPPGLVWQSLWISAVAGIIIHTALTKQMLFNCFFNGYLNIKPIWLLKHSSVFPTIKANKISLAFLLILRGVHWLHKSWFSHMSTWMKSIQATKWVLFLLQND